MCLAKSTEPSLKGMSIHNTIEGSFSNLALAKNFVYVLVMYSSFRPCMPSCQIYPKGLPCPPTGENVSLNKMIRHVNTAVLMPGILGSMMTFSRSTAYTGLHFSTVFPVQCASHLGFDDVFCPTLALCTSYTWRFTTFLQQLFHIDRWKLSKCFIVVLMQLVNFARFAFLLSQLTKTNIHRLHNLLICRIMNHTQTVFVKIISSEGKYFRRGACSLL